jgi:hypothetical protein
VSKLKMAKMAYLGSAATKVQFGNPDDPLARIIKGFGHVVVLLADPEASANGWKAGYYLSAVPAREAAARLGKKLPPPPDPAAAPPASTGGTTA